MELKANNITKEFNNRSIVDDFSISIKKGEYICLVGKSGCGKTTILNMISGMLQPDNGSIFLDDKNIYKDLKETQRTKLRNKNIGYLNYGNCLIESLTIYENLLYPLKIQNRKINDEDITSILDKLEISNIKDSYPGQISAGEYRRVCFARILMLNTDILILDEPTSNLDEHSANIIINIINDLKEKKAIIIATHDKDLMNGKIIKI